MRDAIGMFVRWFAFKYAKEVRNLIEYIIIN